MREEQALPEMPEPENEADTDDCTYSCPEGFSREQMEAYGLACFNAGRVEGAKTRRPRAVWDVTQAEQDGMRDDEWTAWIADLRGATFKHGIEKAAQWVDERREQFESEHGSIDPETGSMDFRQIAQHEYDAELFEIAEGIRALLPTPPAAMTKEKP